MLKHESITKPVSELPASELASSYANPREDASEQSELLLDNLVMLGSFVARIQQYEDALHECTQGVCIYDKNRKVMFSNLRFAQIYGLNAGDIELGMGFETVVQSQIQAGTSQQKVVRDHVQWLNAPIADRRDLIQLIETDDGRQITARHIAYPNGAWLSVHEEVAFAGLSAAKSDEQLSLQHLIDAMPDYMWVKDIKSRFRVANRALALDFGYTDSKAIIGKSDKDFHSAKRARHFRSSELGILRTGQAIIDAEEHIISADGSDKWMSCTKIPLYNKDGHVIGLAGIARDITKRKSMEEFTKGQAQVLEMIATSADLKDTMNALIQIIETQIPGIVGSIMLVDPDKNELQFFAGPRFESAFADKVLRVPIADGHGCCGTAAFYQEIVTVDDIASDPRWDSYRHLVMPFGFQSCWSSPVFDVSRTVVGTFAFYSTEKRLPDNDEHTVIELATRIAGIAIDNRQTKQRVDYLTTHDELTKLRNRATFQEILAQTILYAKRQNNRFSIVHINIDGFKMINDSLGQQTGDIVLKEVSRRLLGAVRASDHVIRLGGDEFVVVLLDQPAVEQASLDVFEKIKSRVSEPVHTDKLNVRITCSIGVAYYPEDGQDSETILANASAAMYRAKEVGRDNIQFYTNSMNTMLREKFDLQSDLRDAIGTDQIFLNYQPQIDLRTGRVFAAEALVRWKHPTLGMVSPAKFIPLAEQSGLILALGNWVLREACEQNKRWQDAGHSPITICVNVSARQFKNRNIVENTLIALEESGLDPHFLELEITESLIMQDTDKSIAIMGELKAMGIRIAIDDFGTGYSSLSALKNFPVARLKIDKSFVDDIAINPRDKAVTSAVISLGQKLNLRVIAEGVENEAQMRILKENDCDEIQGYHFSKPLAPDAFEIMMGRGDWS